MSWETDEKEGRRLSSEETMNLIHSYQRVLEMQISVINELRERMAQLASDDEVLDDVFDEGYDDGFSCGWNLGVEKMQQAIDAALRNKLMVSGYGMSTVAEMALDIVKATVVEMPEREEP